MSLIERVARQRRARPPLWNRIRDYALYSIIAIIVVLAAVGFGIHQGKTGGSPVLPMKWIGFGGMTLIAYGYAISDNTKLWRARGFWLGLSCLWPSWLTC